jgi:glycosyltransferase involved in cell wall biosynthesis
MRILVITEFLRDQCRNGSEVFSRDLIAALGRRHHIDVLATKTDADLPSVTYGLPPTALKDSRALATFLEERIEPGRFDLIYNLGALAFGCGIVQVIAHRLGTTRLVNHFQALLGPYAKRQGSSEAMQAHVARCQTDAAGHAAMNIFASADELRTALVHGFPLERGSVAVVRNGLSLVPFDTVVPWKPEVGPISTGEPVLIVAAGRLQDRVKGASLVARGFKLLHREHPEVRLVCAGPSQRFRHHLSALPAGSAIFHERMERDRLLALFAAADMVVVPSLYEPFGLVALEAQLLGVPVIANDVGGLGEIVRHGRTGLLNPLRNGSLGLYLAMRSLVRHPDEARRMGAEARQWARSRYDINAVAEELEGHLERARLSHFALEPRCSP